MSPTVKTSPTELSVFSPYAASSLSLPYVIERPRAAQAANSKVILHSPFSLSNLAVQLAVQPLKTSGIQPYLAICVAVTPLQKYPPLSPGLRSAS